MDIASVNSTARCSPASPTPARSPSSPSGSPDGPAATDSVELSPTARLYTQLADQPVRADKVSRVREQLAAGEYLHPDQLDAAITGLLKDLDMMA